MAEVGANCSKRTEKESMESLVEGQTLLHGGRYRFLRRMGTGTFAVILRALDAQRGHAVAIKCMLHEAYNAIGEQEADILQQVRRDDAHAQCAIVRLLGTFVEQKRFCLVLEVLGDPILQVARWGPWRQPYQERTLRSPASARRHKLHSLASSKGATAAAQATTPSSSVTYGAANAEAVVASPMPICPSIPPLPLEEIRQDLIHADLKPENIVRNPSTTSGQLSSSASTLSPVKLIDLGNCIETHKIPLYQAHHEGKQDASDDGDAGFDVQTLAYRAPEVAAGVEISTAIDMWSLGCVLLECASGAPLFTTSPSIFGLQHITGKETESEVILKQIEYLVNEGNTLDAACTRYKDAGCYRSSRSSSKKRSASSRQGEDKSPATYLSLSDRLETVAPASETALHAHFRSFIRGLLDINPDTRMTARGALFHPFLQSFFPFRLLFSAAEEKPLLKTIKRSSSTVSPVALSSSFTASSTVKQERAPSVTEDRIKVEEPYRKKKKKQKVIRFATGAEERSQVQLDLRAALKLIPKTGM